MICALTFNHKIGNTAHSGVSEALLFTKPYKWKKQRWEKWTTGRLLLETMRFWRSPTVPQFRISARRMWAQQKLNFSMWPDNGLTLLCYFLAAFPSLNVSEHVYGIKHMFTYLLKNITPWTSVSDNDTIKYLVIIELDPVHVLGYLCDLTLEIQNRLNYPMLFPALANGISLPLWRFSNGSIMTPLIFKLWKIEAHGVALWPYINPSPNTLLANFVEMLNSKQKCRLFWHFR